MDYDPNWSRWIMSSAVRHFKTCNTHFYVEGFERDTTGKSEWVEFRLDGPYIKEQTKGHWVINIEINLMVIVNASKNTYRIEEIKGDVIKRFLDCIDVYKLGQQEPDDNTLLGCMRLVQKGRDRIIATNFGVVKPDIKQMQSSVEGHYQMHLG